MQVCIAHPRLVQTGLDYVEYGGRRGLFFLKQVFPGFLRRRVHLTAFARLRDSVDHRRLTYYPPAIPSACSFENQRGHFFDLASREREGVLLHLFGERDPRFALAVENHAGICLACIREQLAMAKFGVYEPLLAAAARAIRKWLGFR